MTRIVHLGYMHKSRDTRIFEKECKSLLSLTKDIHFVTSNRNSSESEITEEGINLQVIPLKDIRFLRMIIYVNQLKKKCKELDADIYHIHEPYLLPLVTYLKRRNKKVIYDKHENTFYDMRDRLSNLIGKRLGNFVAQKIDDYEKKCVKKCDGYIYVTPQYEMKDVKCKSILIPNFPILQEQDFDVEAEDSQNQSKGDFKLCYGGGVAPIWSILEISKIINSKMDEDISFEIAGPVGAGYKEEIEESNLKNRCNYHGILKHSEVKDLYKDSDVGMAILKKEIGGSQDTEGTLANTKIYEFMQQGLPVIFTNFTIWEDMLKEYNFGIPVDPLNFDEIESAIRFLMENRDVAKKMGMEGRRAVLEKYNWQSSEKEFLNLYRDLI